MVCKNCKKGHSHQECRSDPICFYCKAKGHRLYECPLVKQKGARPPTMARQQAGVAAGVTQITETDETSAEVVATVREQPGITLELSSPIVEVIEVGGQNCKLAAMLDTGSPVSFIKRETYNKLIKLRDACLEPSNRRFKDLGNNVLKIDGLVRTTIVIRDLGDQVLPIKLYVLYGNSFPGDIIIGREFLYEQRVKLEYELYKNRNGEYDAKVKLFSHLPLFVDDVESERDVKRIIDSHDVDFGSEVKDRLRDVVVGVEEQDVTLIEDGYEVEVRMKDHSVYAYAPRRCAYAERIKIREITKKMTY